MSVPWKATIQHTTDIGTAAPSPDNGSTTEAVQQQYCVRKAARRHFTNDKVISGRPRNPIQIVHCCSPEISARQPEPHTTLDNLLAPFFRRLPAGTNARTRTKPPQKSTLTPQIA
uniref:Uncharacterized protein n=1 Tax=Eutreptiella gymnastica TaxID=73025 RepID=A0A7S4FZ12_9EUGL